jgi:hypothetical protein
MNHRMLVRSLRGSLAGCLLLTLAPVSSNAAVTQNFSGFQDKTLSLYSNATDILMNATMGGTCQGSFTKVQVTKDTETQLTVSVTYTGFKSCYLTGRLMVDQKTPLKGFQPVGQALTQDGGSVELTFRIDPAAAPAGADIKAGKLYLTVGQGEGASRYYRATFHLGKRFMLANVLTDVTATPLGSAANIPRTTVAPATGTVALPKIRIYQKLERAPTAATVSTRSLYLNKVDEPAKLNIMTRPTATTDQVKVAQPRMVSSAATRFVLPSAATTTAQPPSQPPAQPPAPNLTPQGPDDKALPLFESLVTDYDFEYPFEITNIRLDVYPDKNKSAGTYYFLPSSYNLLYETDRGMQFVIDYGTSTSADSAQTVRMSGKLTAGIGKKEIDVVGDLVKAYIKSNTQLGYPTDRFELRALQITGAPTVDFDTDLKQYNITNQTVNATSLTEPVDVSWRTDQANATDLSNSLKANVGIIGKMTLKPQGGTLSDQTIPVRIRLADERTLGRFTLTQGWRSRNWKNTTPYPVKLRNLHVLWVNGNTPAVYTWNLGDKEIEPGAEAHLLADAVPAWLDAESNARFWMEYEVESCESCHDAVLKTIIHSTVQAQSQQIKFKLLTFFADYKLNSMVINVSTKQADAVGETMQTLPPIEVAGDARDYMSGKIYVPRGESPAFEFQLQLIDENGALSESAWMPRKDLIVPIGKAQIKELFPQLATQ